MHPDNTRAPRQAPINEPRLLDTLYFYLTEGCNLACTHCWLSPALDPQGKKYSLLPKEIFQQIIHEALPLGLKKVKLTGGEPLLHPEIQVLLDLVYHENLELILETNGLLCTPEIAANIGRQHNPFVSVSLDGINADTHDTHRGKKGAFELTVQAIRNLIEHKVPTQIIMSIMRDNVDQLEGMITLAESLGVGSLKFNLVQPVGRGKSYHHKDKSIPIEELIALGRKTETFLAAKTEITLFFDFPPAFKSLRQFAPNADGCNTCGIVNILGVLANGDYALCGIGSQVRELVFGNARENLLSEIWLNNPTILEIYQGLPDKLTGICSRCLMKYNCLGSCMAHNYYSSGSIWSPFWFCKEAEAEGLFPESRHA